MDTSADEKTSVQKAPDAPIKQVSSFGRAARHVLLTTAIGFVLSVPLLASHEIEMQAYNLPNPGGRFAGFEDVLLVSFGMSIVGLVLGFLGIWWPTLVLHFARKTQSKGMWLAGMLLQCLLYLGAATFLGPSNQGEDHAWSSLSKLLFVWAAAAMLAAIWVKVPGARPAKSPAVVV